MALNVFCLRNLKFLLKEFQVVMSLENWRRIAFTVCNASVLMTL